jgi:hypothetical protein
VEKIAKKPSVKGGVNTSLLLSDENGKTEGVHLKGEDPALVPGAKIEAVKISKKTRDGVVYLILESYAAAREAA